MMINLFSRPHVVLFLFLAGVGLPLQAGAEPAELDQEFLDMQVPLVLAAAREESLKVATPAQALEATSRLLILRREALVQLEGRVPLFTFDGIETQDAYDHVVVTAIHGLISPVAEADTTFPAEHSPYFNEVVGSLPDPGSSPVPFMVLGIAELAIATADSLWSDPTIPQQAVAKLALRMIHASSTLYEVSRSDAFAAASATSFRQSAVLMRLRCPKDGGRYRKNGMKTKVHSTAWRNVRK
jgi:hypothetical protein